MTTDTQKRSASAALTRGQARVLVDLAVAKNGAIPRVGNTPNTRICNALISMGFVVALGSSYYKITSLGLDRCKSIY